MLVRQMRIWRIATPESRPERCIVLPFHRHLPLVKVSLYEWPFPPHVVTPGQTHGDAPGVTDRRHLSSLTFVSEVVLGFFDQFLLIAEECSPDPVPVEILMLVRTLRQQERTDRRDLEGTSCRFIPVAVRKET